MAEITNIANPTSLHDAPFDLSASAVAEMQHDGFDLTPIPGAAEQLAAIVAAPPAPAESEDWRGLPWSSIDNDTSRDLDQIEWAEARGESIVVRVGIADVAATVAKDTPLDQFAARQTQTVYTPAHNFPMLPVELSTGLTSLNPGEDRNALVAEFAVGKDGAVTDGRVLAARVRNTAQLTYSRVGPLLDAFSSGSSHDSMMVERLGDDSAHASIGIEPCIGTAANASMSVEMLAQLRLQAEAARRIRGARQAAGALDFRRAEAQPVVVDGKVLSLETSRHNAAMDLIEDLMIAANETAARTLREARRSALRRVVRSPERWARIVALFAPLGAALPETPDSGALNTALAAQRAKDPDHYPDLALAVIKLMGAGEYVLVSGDDPSPPSHFALAAQDYSHSTAPNRRFADLVTQRLLHALLRGEAAPYSDAELSAIASRCNQMDSAARKVERAMTKRAQAMAMAGEIGREFPAVVTGAGPKGTFVRVLQPPIEGMLVHPHADSAGKALDVGDRLTVRLVHTDAARSFIDFQQVNGSAS